MRRRLTPRCEMNDRPGSARHCGAHRHAVHGMAGAVEHGDEMVSTDGGSFRLHVAVGREAALILGCNSTAKKFNGFQNVTREQLAMAA